MGDEGQGLLPNTVMGTPEVPVTEDVAAEPPVPVEPGTTVGRYRIVELLATGGMGQVYVAVDPELDRRIALKLLSVRQDKAAASGLLRDRLQREARALARLSHPNVIAIHDVGTHQGDVFIAMELVAGRTLRKWLGEAKRSQREILEVLIAAGRGLRAAHEAGLVHRDFKADNVIVGDDGRVRVLDFGLARAASIEPAAAEIAGQILSTPITIEGSVLGTPGYMAPEQYQGGRVDEKTDQFCFCITAYEALYREHPFGDAVGEIRTATCTGQVRASEGADVPAHLRKALLRGLAVDPAARYPAMDALLHDLGFDPLAARRRRLATLGVLGGIALGTFGLWRGFSASSGMCRGMDSRLAGIWDDASRRAFAAAFGGTGLPHAPYAAQQVQRILDRYSAEWTKTATDTCEGTRVRGAKAERIQDLRLACLDRRLAKLSALVTQFRTPTRETIDRAVGAASDLPPIAGCADDAALLAAVPPPEDPKVRARLDELRKQLDLAEAQKKTAQYDAGTKLATKIVEDASSLDYRPFQAEASFLLGELHERGGDIKGAEPIYREALATAAAAGDDDVVAQCWCALLSNIAKQSRLDEAYGLRTAAEVAVARAGNAPMRKADLARTIGRILYERGKPDEALARFDEATALQQQVLGKDDFRVAESQVEAGNALFMMGKYDEARARYEQAMVTQTKALGPDHPTVSRCLNNIALVLHAQGHYPEARDYYERSERGYEKALGPDHPLVINGLYNLGVLLAEMGDFAEAKKVLTRTLEIRRRTLGDGNAATGHSEIAVGEVFQAEKDYRGALAHFDRALAIYAKALPADHALVAYPLTSAGECYQRLGQNAQAIASLEHAVKIREGKGGDPEGLAHSRFALADALWSAGRDHGRARTLAQKAREGYAAAGDRGKKKLPEVDGWLAKHRG